MLLIIGLLLLPWATAVALRSMVPSSGPSLAPETIKELLEIYPSNASIPILELHNFHSEQGIQLIAKLLDVELHSTLDDKGMRFGRLPGGEAIAFKYSSDWKINPDISILYLHSSMIMDELTILHQVQQAISSISSITDDRKRSFIVVFTGPSKELSKKSETMIGLLNEAYSSIERVKINGTMVLPQLDVQLIAIPDGKIVESSLKNFREKVSALQQFARPLQDFTFLPTKPSPTSKGEDTGMNTCLEAVEDAYAWAKEAVTTSTSKSLLKEKEFRSFLDNLQKSALQVYMEKIKSKGVSMSSKIIGQKELVRMVYDLMLPFFRRNVQEIRKDITDEFNKAAGDELETTVYLINDLQSIRDEMLRKFNRRIRALIPSDAPSTWSGQFEVFKFKSQLDEYIETREVQGKLQGILLRTRHPIALSFHVLLNHPLGRDYRQDTIGVY